MAQQHTYAMIKPGYEAFWGKVIDRITQEGLEIVNMKTMKFDDDFAAKFYAEHVGKPFYKDLAGYMTSGKIVALELAGPNAIAKWREIIGPTKKEVAVELHSMSKGFNMTGWRLSWGWGSCTSRMTARTPPPP